jgi:chromosome segregation ATPase
MDPAAEAETTIAWLIDPADLALAYQKSAALRAARITSLLKQVEKLETKVEKLSRINDDSASLRASVESAAKLHPKDIEVLRSKTSWQRGQIAKLAGKNDALQSKVEWQKNKLARQDADVAALRSKVEWQRGNLARQSEKADDLRAILTSQKSTLAEQESVMESQAVRIRGLEKQLEGYSKFKNRRSVRVLRSMRNRLRSWFS